MAASAGVQEVGQKTGLSKKSKFPIRESGYWTCEAPIGGCVYWLDNERVIFNGAKPGDMENLPDGRRVSKHAIYIWNLKTNTVTKYADAAKSVLCYADGHIRYSRKDGSYTVVLAGPFGKEAELSRTHDKDRFDKRGEEFTYLNRFSCKTYKQSEISPLPGARIPLKEGHGYLYLGASNSPDDHKKSIVYYPPQQPQGITLPLARWQVRSTQIKAIDFRRSYLLIGDQIYNRSDRCLPEGFSRRVYRLSLNGQIEAIDLPPRKELRCYVEWGGLNEVRVGITAHVNTGRLDSSYLYLIQNEQLRTIARGRVSDSAVSPNGCRMAVGVSSTNDSHKPVTAEFYRGHLKVIEFCIEGGG
jgi:hypothetical protein